MNGMEAAQYLREKYGEQVKIYLLTGNIMMNYVENSELFDGVLTKPYSKKDIQSVLACCFKR